MKKQIKKHNKLLRDITLLSVLLVSYATALVLLPPRLVCYSEVVDHNSSYEQTNPFSTKNFFKTSITFKNGLSLENTELINVNTSEIATIEGEEEEIFAEEDIDILTEEFEDVIPNEYCVEISNRVFELLCRTVQTEVTIDKQGQKNVVYVILNRLNNGRFGGSIEEIMFAPNQFSAVGSDKFWNLEIYDETKEHVAEALRDYPQSNRAYDALYFRSNGYFSWAEYIFTDNVGHNFFK